MTTDKARLNVYIPQELKDRLDRLAQQDRRSLSVTVEILYALKHLICRAKMNRSLYSFAVLLVILLSACTSSEPPVEPTADLKTITLDSTVNLIAGQTVYVPIYSHIYTWERSRTMDLTATLSIRNTDLTNPLILTAVSYYDSNGKLVRNYLEQPVELNRMASTSFVVDQADASGGSGAAFVVEWVAEKQVSTPVVEAVMINAVGNQGVSFISPGRVIKNQIGSN